MTVTPEVIAQIEALPVYEADLMHGLVDVLDREDVLAILRAAPSPAPVVKCPPERIWAEVDRSYEFEVEKPDASSDWYVEYIRADLAPTGNAALVEVLTWLRDTLSTHITDNGLDKHRLILDGKVYEGPAVDWARNVLTGIRDITDKTLTTPAAVTTQTEDVGELRKAYDDLLFKVGAVMEDYWPDKPSDAPQALDEMREALLHIYQSAAFAKRTEGKG